VSRILVTGGRGQIGWELQRSLLSLGEIISLDRSALDLANLRAIPGIVDSLRPSVIVNAAAFTAVDRAEAEVESARLVNGEAVGVLGEAARRNRAVLIHYSTDYVFNGAKDSPYEETDAPSPVCEYGSSKLLGERRLAESGCDYICLRTSWVFASRGQNFLLTMLRLGREREQLRVVNDQFGTPTWARFIADATGHIIGRVQSARDARGFQSEILHLTAAGSTSWHGFASEIFRQWHELNDEARVPKVSPITSSEFPTAAQRPANSRMCCTRLQQRFGIMPPPWQQTVRLCLEEVKHTMALA
jgi:dTDP-4-dehydrorhamnose reductase